MLVLPSVLQSSWKPLGKVIDVEAHAAHCQVANAHTIMAVVAVAFLYWLHCARIYDKGRVIGALAEHTWWWWWLWEGTYTVNSTCLVFSFSGNNIVAIRCQ